MVIVIVKLHLIIRRIVLLATALGLILPVLCAAQKPPNVVLILADDLGYSNIGCYGGEIDTPHLNRLAAHGVDDGGQSSTRWLSR